MKKHRLLFRFTQTCNKKNVKTTIQQHMKIKVNIAANAAGVTLAKYIDYQNAVDKVEQVHIITGKSTESIKILQMHVIDEIISKFEAALQLSPEGFDRKVRLGITELGFVPNLNEMSFGEYIDLDSSCSNLYQDGKLNGEAALKMMCILYRPIKAKFGKYYDIAPYSTTAIAKYKDDVKQLTLAHVLNVLLFFSSLEIELYNSSLEYLAKEITEIVKEMKQEQPLMD
jgi:hypothetical protein